MTQLIASPRKSAELPKGWPDPKRTWGRWLQVFLAPHMLLIPPSCILFLLWLAAHSWVGSVLAIAVVLLYLRSYDGAEKKHGRFSAKFIKWWLPCHDYFPVRLLVWDGKGYSDTPNKGHEEVFNLDNTRYVFGLHPHGPLPAIASIFMPQLMKFGYLFEKMRLAVASAVFWVPIMRDVYLWFGCVDASRNVLLNLLKDGYSVTLLPGGEEEQLTVCPPGVEQLVLRKRKGFIRLAINTGASLVPVIGFGERDCYTSSTFLLGFRLWLVKRFRIGIPIAWGQFPLFLMPRIKPILIVIGEPIPTQQEDNPSPEIVDMYLERYIAAVERIYEEHKHQVGHSDRILKIL